VRSRAQRGVSNHATSNSAAGAVVPSDMLTLPKHRAAEHRAITMAPQCIAGRKALEAATSVYLYWCRRIDVLIISQFDFIC
jgi:hypothetical protein